MKSGSKMRFCHMITFKCFDASKITPRDIISIGPLPLNLLTYNKQSNNLLEDFGLLHLAFPYATSPGFGNINSDGLSIIKS